MALKNGKGTVNGYKIGPKADLRGANLGGADLRKADLRDADLREAYLLGANLLGANLTDANLYGADLYGATLTGATLTGADLGLAHLDGALFFDAVVDPHHFRLIEAAKQDEIASLCVNRTPNPRHSLPRFEYDPVAEERAKAEYFEGIESGRYPSPHDVLKEFAADGALRSPARPRGPSRKHRGR